MNEVQFMAQANSCPGGQFIMGTLRHLLLILRYSRAHLHSGNSLFRVELDVMEGSHFLQHLPLALVAGEEKRLLAVKSEIHQHIQHLFGSLFVKLSEAFVEENRGWIARADELHERQAEGNIRGVLGALAERFDASCGAVYGDGDIHIVGNTEGAVFSTRDLAHQLTCANAEAGCYALAEIFCRKSKIFVRGLNSAVLCARLFQLLVDLVKLDRKAGRAF